MQEETQIGRGNDKLRWKQTLTFNALYRSKRGPEGGGASEEQTVKREEVDSEGKRKGGE